MSKDDYDIGYGRPPKHTQFVPGESGNKGRKKKRPEFQAEMIARIRDEQVMVQGKPMSMFELAVRSVLNSTIKRGHPRDLKALLDLLNKYGAIPQSEALEDARAAGEAVIKKLFDHFDRVNDVDPADELALDMLRKEEAAIVMACPGCSPTLRESWNLPERKALSERYGQTGLQTDVASKRRNQKGLGMAGQMRSSTGPDDICDCGMKHSREKICTLLRS